MLTPGYTLFVLSSQQATQGFCVDKEDAVCSCCLGPVCTYFIFTLFFFFQFFFLFYSPGSTPIARFLTYFSYIVLTYLPKTTRRCSFWSSSNARAATVLHTSLRRRIPCVRGILKVTFLFWEPKVDMSAYQAQAQANSQSSLQPGWTASRRHPG